NAVLDNGFAGVPTELRENTNETFTQSNDKRWDVGGFGRHGDARYLQSRYRLRACTVYRRFSSRTGSDQSHVDCCADGRGQRWFEYRSTIQRCDVSQDAPDNWRTRYESFAAGYTPGSASQSGLVEEDLGRGTRGDCRRRGLPQPELVAFPGDGHLADAGFNRQWQRRLAGQAGFWLGRLGW